MSGMGRQGEKICPKCGAKFTCGMVAGREPCWCAELPPLPFDPDATACFCPDCLKKEIIARQPGGA